MIKFHLPTRPYCFIAGEVETDQDWLACRDSRMNKIEDSPEVKGTFIIHVATDIQYEWFEDTITGTFREAKIRHNEMYKLIQKPDDTPLPTEDGTYIIWQGGKKKMYTRKLNYKGLPQEKLKEFYNDYVEGSIECNPANVTKDFTN